MWWSHTRVGRFVAVLRSGCGSNRARVFACVFAEFRRGRVGVSVAFGAGATLVVAEGWGMGSAPSWRVVGLASGSRMVRDAGGVGHGRTGRARRARAVVVGGEACPPALVGAVGAGSGDAQRIRSDRGDGGDERERADWCRGSEWRWAGRCAVCARWCWMRGCGRCRWGWWVSCMWRVAGWRGGIGVGRG